MKDFKTEKIEFIEIPIRLVLNVCPSEKPGPDYPGFDGEVEILEAKTIGGETLIDLLTKQQPNILEDLREKMCNKKDEE